jgi:hypothetical protein
VPLPRPKPDDDEVDCVIPLDPNKLPVPVAGVVVVLPNNVDPNPLCCC